MKPCPFCANPAPFLRRWWSGPYTIRKAGRREVRDYGTLLGWQVHCLCCNAILRATTKAEAVDRWNTRGDAQAPACPLCAGESLRVSMGADPDVQLPKARPSVQIVTCEGCGLRLVGYRRVYEAGNLRDVRLSALESWGVRIAPADFVDPNAAYQAAAEASRDAGYERIRKEQRKRLAAGARYWLRARDRGRRQWIAGMETKTEATGTGKLGSAMTVRIASTNEWDTDATS